MEQGIEIRMGKGTAIILACALVAITLMVLTALRKPIPVNVSVEQIQPVITVAAPTVTVRPRVIIKKIVVAAPTATADPVFEHRTPIVPNSLKANMLQFGFGHATGEAAINR